MRQELGHVITESCMVYIILAVQKIEGVFIRIYLSIYLSIIQWHMTTFLWLYIFTVFELADLKSAPSLKLITHSGDSDWGFTWMCNDTGIFMKHQGVWLSPCVSESFLTNLFLCCLCLWFIKVIMLQSVWCPHTFDKILLCHCQQNMDYKQIFSVPE